MKSVAKVENNYLYKTGTGVAVHNSDLTCSRYNYSGWQKEYSIYFTVYYIVNAAFFAPHCTNNLFGEIKNKDRRIM